MASDVLICFWLFFGFFFSKPCRFHSHNAEQKDPKVSIFESFCYFCIPSNFLSFAVFSVIITISIMRFLLFVSLTAIAIANTNPEDIPFLDDSLDMSDFQDSSQDSFALPDFLEGSLFTDHNDDGLFDDSGVNDFSSIETQDSIFQEASCSTENGQSLNKLRSRGGEACIPSASDSSSLEPLTNDKYWDVIRNQLDGIEVRPDKYDVRCLPNFPVHLCCHYVGKELPSNWPKMPLMIPPGYVIYYYVRSCNPGGSAFVLLLFCFFFVPTFFPYHISFDYHV